MTIKPLNWGLLSTARINRALITPLRASARNHLAAVRRFLDVKPFSAEGRTLLRATFSEAAMTKLFTSQVAERVASECVEIFGANGFVRDSPAEKYYRDAKVGKIDEGASNMQLATIAKHVL